MAGEGVCIILISADRCWAFAVQRWSALIRTCGGETRPHKIPEVSMKPVSDLPPDIAAPSPVTWSSSTAPEPETRSLASDRVEWLVPPPVMPLTEGKWTMWEEWVADGNDMFFRHTSSHPQGCEEVYYDQKERQQIFVVEPMTIPPRVVSDINTYGVPAPTMCFVKVVDDQIKKASHWLYKKRIPTRGSTGLEAPIPDPNDLPLTTSLEKTSGVSVTVINPESAMPSMLNLIPTPSVVTPLLIQVKSI